MKVTDGDFAGSSGRIIKPLFQTPQIRIRGGGPGSRRYSIPGELREVAQISSDKRRTGETVAVIVSLSLIFLIVFIPGLLLSALLLFFWKQSVYQVGIETVDGKKFVATITSSEWKWLRDYTGKGSSWLKERGGTSESAGDPTVSESSTAAKSTGSGFPKWSLLFWGLIILAVIGAFSDRGSSGPKERYVWTSDGYREPTSDELTALMKALIAARNDGLHVTGCGDFDIMRKVNRVKVRCKVNGTRYFTVDLGMNPPTVESSQ